MDEYIGMIKIFAGSFAPVNWAFCEGQILHISQNEALWSIVGFNYGGDGSQTFALPNLAPIADIDGKGVSRYIICVSGLYPQRP